MSVLVQLKHVSSGVRFYWKQQLKYSVLTAKSHVTGSAKIWLKEIGRKLMRAETPWLGKHPINNKFSYRADCDKYNVSVHELRNILLSWVCYH